MKRPVRIRQQDMTDCGAACLASIGEWYGVKHPISRIRQWSSTDQNGTNILGMIEAAEKMGFIAKGVRCNTDNLQHIPVPLIAHLKMPEGFFHFVVVYQVKGKKIFYMDPAEGSLNKVIIEDFRALWTGVMIILTPCEKFQPGNHRISIFQRFLKLIRPQSAFLIQAFLGAALYSILGLAISLYVQKIVDNILPERNNNLLNLLSVIMILLLIFRVFLGMMKSIYLMKAGQFIDGSLILGYYRHLLKLRSRFFDTMRTGEMISRINDAVKIRFFISNTAIDLVVSSFTIIVSVILTVFISLKITAIIIVAIPAFVLVYFLFNRTNKRMLRKVMEKTADLESQLVESLNGITTIRYLGLEKLAFSKTESAFVKLLSSTYTAGKHGIFANHGSGMLAGLVTIILLWAGSFLVFQQQLTPGELMLLYSLFGYLLGPISALINMNRTIQDALIAADRLFQIMDMEQDKTDRQYLINLTPSLSDDIHFEHVSFRYGNRNDILNDLNLTIFKNEITGITGESGCGKSTMAALLMNIYPVRSGRIRIGKYDILDIHSDSLRNTIGIVPQRIDLFTGNFIDNIAPGVYQPDMKMIMNLCELTGLNSLLDSLPEGLLTPLGERGLCLSGGEMQKVAIVRALYRNPSILILDEATSSLDSYSEMIIRNLILDIKKNGKTLIIIAHRLTSLAGTDRIICIHDGKAAESGSHHELIQLQGHYYRLWNNQFPSEACQDPGWFSIQRDPSSLRSSG